MNIKERFLKNPITTIAGAIIVLFIGVFFWNFKDIEDPKMMAQIMASLTGFLGIVLPFLKEK